jgi:hypothetical protein
MSPKLLNILLLLISGVLYGYVITPLYYGDESLFFDSGNGITILKQKLAVYDKTIAEVPNIFKKAQEAQQQYDAISPEDRKKILTMVPVEVNDIKLYSELTNIGIDSGVPLDDMGIKDKGNGEYTVSFSVTTNYNTFKKVMKTWENSMRLFRLNTITFNPGKTEEDPVKFSIELSTYYMK